MISSSPSQLLKNKDPLGGNNDLIILKILEFWSENINCDLWLGWGDKGHLSKRDQIVLEIIKDLLKLDSKENNYPRHVLVWASAKKGVLVILSICLMNLS